MYFPTLPEIFCTLVYGYVHDDIFVLKSVPRGYLELFFTDFVLRKVSVEPHQYTYALASVKLFYRFLTEKGYMGSPQPVALAVDQIEPHFIQILRERFG